MRRTNLVQPLTRRLFMGRTALIGGGLAASGLLARSGLAAPASITSDKVRPTIPNGVQSGDVGMDRGIVWSRTDRPARMIVEYSTTESFKNPRRVVGPAALDVTDFTAKVDLRDLPPGQTIFYRVQFEDLAEPGIVSEAAVGRFRTAPGHARDVAFVWSGDTAGQGWGINEDWGGMKIYEVMRKSEPDFFIHSGDTIYADGPIQAEVKLPDGTLWKNVTIEEKSKVAETLAEFRGNFRYNLVDANVRRLAAEVPMFAQWDDHETTNNWYPGEMLDDRYTEKSASLLSARARRAFSEYMPIREEPTDPDRIYRAISYGPLLDVFFLDMRTYRATNSGNRQPVAGAETAFMGADQIRWLKQQLLASRATWKAIAADMPIGIVVADGKEAFEAIANGDGPVLGREHEIADLLRFIKQNGIRNTVWFTADVHYTAAHYYDPGKAQFTDFEPFWEFVSGPLNAGSFGPGKMDDTFGPQVVYTKHPDGKANTPPTAGLQFFGETRIDGRTEVMTVMLKDLKGDTLYSVDLEPKLG